MEPMCFLPCGWKLALKQKGSTAFVFLLFSLIIITNCSKINPNNNIPSIYLDQNKVYFLASNYENSYLYSLNLSTRNIILEPTSAILSGDILGLQKRDADGNMQNMYTIERFSTEGLPSRVTVYNSLGNIYEDTKHFPQNLYDMILVNNSLYAVGFDKKEITQSSPILDTIALTKTSVRGFQNTAYADSESFQAILNNENNYYVVSIGNLGSKQAAHVYKLDPSLTERSHDEVNSWPIMDTHQQITCYRMSSTTQRISNSKIVVACNPSYAMLAGLPTIAAPSLFLIDVSTSNPVITLLGSTDISIDIILGGISKDKNSIFVTEEIYDEKNFSTLTIHQSYWLNISNPINPIKTLNNQVAYSVTYNNIIDSYIYSCVLNESMKCLKNTFGLAPSGINNLSSTEITKLTLENITNLNGASSISFFKDL